MTIARRAAPYAIGVIVVGTTLLLAACSATPAPLSAPHRTSPSSHPALAPYAVPTVQRGELARIVYTRPGTVNGISVRVPAGEFGYDVDFGCQATNPLHKFGFELMHGRALVVAATGVCNGTPLRDTAILSYAPAETLELVFTGDLSKVSKAYAVLLPAQDG
jgi:hypothetical protein